MKTKNPRFEIYQVGGSWLGPYKPREVIKPKGGEWRWRLIARNGEIIASGEGFTREKGAHRAVAAVKRAVAKIVEGE